MDVKSSIEFSERHADTNEKTWRVDIRTVTTDGQEELMEDVQVVTADDINMGGVLDFVNNWIANKMEEPDSNIIEYEIMSIRRVNICACCNKEISFGEHYCNYHYDVIHDMQQEWNKLVDRG